MKKKILETQYNDDYCNVFLYRVCLFYHNLNSGCFFYQFSNNFYQKKQEIEVKINSTIHYNEQVNSTP